MNITRILPVILVAGTLSGCAAGVKVIEPVKKDAKIGVVQFEDCQTASISFTDCVGSGKIAAKMFSATFGNCPILPADTDPNVKAFDVLITGKVLGYNKGVPVPIVGRPNYAHISVMVKRTTDGKVVATQEDEDSTHNILGKNPDQIIKGLADELKEKMSL